MPTILITGANRGIGLEFAKQYAADGWEVIGTARQPGEADELNALENCETMQLDVADTESFGKFMSTFGARSLDLFVHNAGIYGSRALDRETWLETLEINTVAPTLLAERIKPNIMAGGQKKMAVLSSRMGSIGESDAGHAIIYRSSKAGLNAAWKALSNDYRKDGIAVAILHPGWVQTDMGGENATLQPETSVTGMRKVLDGLTVEKTGQFTSYDGTNIAW